MVHGIRRYDGPVRVMRPGGASPADRFPPASDPAPAVLRAQADTDDVAANDGELTLEHWQRVHQEKPTPASRIWLAHLLVAADRIDEARDMARLIAPKARRVHHLRLAERKLFHPALISDWLRLTNALLAEIETEPLDESDHRSLTLRIYSRLSRIGDLLSAGPAERQDAREIWRRLDPASQVGYLKSDIRVVDYVQLFGIDEAGAGEVQAAIAVANWSRLAGKAHTGILAHHRDGDISTVELVRYAARFPQDVSLINKVARAIMGAHAEAEALELASACPAILSAVRAALIAAALDGGEFWTAEWLLATFHARNDGDKRLQEVGADSARRMRDPWLALVRALPDEAASASLGLRLIGLGYYREANRLLTPHIQQNEDTALAWIESKKWELASVNDSEPVRALYERLGGTKLRNALASNLVDELDYGGAERLLLESIAEKPHRISVWRDLCGFYRRTIDFTAWLRTIREMDERFPDNPWVKTQHMIYAFEIGDRAAIDAAMAMPTPTVIDKDNIHQVRVLARQYMVEDRQKLALESRRRIVQYSDTPSEYVRAVQSTFQAGEFDRAVEIVDTCVNRFPGDGRFHIKRAQAHERRQNYAAALQSFSRALAVGINSPDAQSGIARCLVYTGQAEAALRWLDRFPQDRIEMSWVHSMRAFAHAYSGNDAAILPALEPIYALCRRLNQEFEDARRADPAAVWYNGLRRHPDPHWPRYADLYQREIDRMRTSSIALVGNSPGLLGEGKGAAIDRFDYIIRLNDFRLHGYEPDVGSKTSLWYSSANRMARPDQAAVHGARTFIYQPRAQHFPDLTTFARGRLNVELEEDAATYLPPHVHLLTSRMIYPRPSTGLRMCTMLEFLVQRPYAIAGLDFFRSQQLHYFEQEQTRLRVGEVHAIDFEKDFTEMVLARCGFMSRL